MINIGKKVFGTSKDGKTCYEYTLTGKDVILSLTDHGASITKLFVRDREGSFRDVELGFDTLDEYTAGTTTFGAFVGRVANRISNHSFTLEGVNYTLDQNNNHACLHGGFLRYNMLDYDAMEIGAPDGKGILFSRISPDGEQGFPGNLTLNIAYILTEEGGVRIEYRATSDKATIVNLTNHSFFNLDGEETGNIEDQYIRINSSIYQKTDDELIPVSLAPVDGTKYDLRKERKMREEGGFDTSFILDLAKEGEPAAVARSAKSGIKMEVFTNQKAIQLYTAKNNKFVGKGGHHYDAYSGFCLETQAYVDAANRPEYPSIEILPGEEYFHTVTYRFSVSD
jgi:Galactose mutarotase and related enzymes